MRGRVRQGRPKGMKYGDAFVKINNYIELW